MDITMIVDTIWVLLAAVLVFFMNLGFAAVESGFARSKNTVNILSKNFIVFAVSSLGFMLLGWGLMFGGDGLFAGTQHLSVLSGSSIEFYKDTLTPSVPFWGKFFFQLVFCGTAATIVSGAVAERVKYISFILFSFILTLVIYPIVGHWIWGGGWLARLGFLDFAGDTVYSSAVACRFSQLRSLVSSLSARLHSQRPGWSGAFSGKQLASVSALKRRPRASISASTGTPLILTLLRQFLFWLPIMVPQPEY
jgi:hypothetical protein